MLTHRTLLRTSVLAADALPALPACGNRAKGRSIVIGGGGAFTG